MDDNKKNELDLSLNVDALNVTEEDSKPEQETETETETETKPEIGINEIEVAEIESVEVENVEAQDPPPMIETEDVKWHREKRSRPPKEKKPKPPKPPKAEKPPKPPKKPAAPISEPLLPLIVCTVTFAISLLALIIDRFVFSFSQELLAPVILQLIALILPAYLSMMITSGNKSAGVQFKEIGFHKIRADHIFLMIFTALFTMCASLALTLMLGGATDASRGITLLGTFTAGVNEYTVSYPYLILTYVLIPAIAEELLFRGVIFSHLERISFPLAATVSCVMSALYGFSLGGLIPTLFTAAMLTFVLYTTGSIIPCIIVHLLVNLYKLFLEANIASYFLSSQNDFLLFITVSGALLISALLFFSESVRLFRARAQKIARGEEKSAKKSEKLPSLASHIRSTLAYKPSLILTVVCCVIFASAVVINYLV